MADFVAVLKKTLDGLGETTPAMRERVYEKARVTISTKLAAISPPPPPGVVDRQKRALEEAIVAIEKEYAAASDPLSELEDVFASLKNPQPKVLAQPAVKTGAWPKTTPAASPARPANGAARSAPPPLPVQPSARAEPEQNDHADFTVQRTDAVRKRSYGPLLAVALVLAVLAGGGYGIWLNRDAFGGLFGLGPQDLAANLPAEAPATDAAEPLATDAPSAAAPGEEPKLTQRLTPEGNETDPGPASGATGVGEGTSVSALTQQSSSSPPLAAQPGETPDAGGAADPTTPGATPDVAATDTPAAPDAALAVGQKAIFYEERTSAAEGSAEPGSVVWSLVQESPGGNLPPEPAVRAEATIPGKDVKLRMTIKRNADQTLPASHIIEMIFLTPEGFAGGGVENILRVAMKGSEQEAGNPLIGIPAKIADGFFLVALNDTKAEIDANMTLLRRQSWIDVPIVYKTGRRALFTMEKGIPGDKVFDEALKAWAASAAPATAPG